MTGQVLVFYYITQVSAQVAFYTLGCKLNHAESDSLEAAFEKAGWKVLPNGVKDGGNLLFVINSCTVTSKAEQKLRRVIRLALKNTRRTIIVTGCAVKENRKIDGAYYLAGINKASLFELARLTQAQGTHTGNGQELRAAVDSWFSRTLGTPDNSEKSVFEFEMTQRRSRPFLKIQDGCNKRCSYCAVPDARGKSVSIGKETALERLIQLENAGYMEAVLSGVNLCAWESPDGENLAALISYLLKGTSKIRLRLSSIQPDAFMDCGSVDAAMLDALSPPRIRPHFHISVQSGSARVLRAMGRRYTALNVEELCGKLRLIKKDPFLACDIITGFPGETDNDFEDTFNLCERCDFAWIHAFPFSPRDGTPAASMKGRVPERISVERTARLIELAKKQKAIYEKRWENQLVEIIAENRSSRKKSFVNAVTENYLKCAVRQEEITGSIPSVYFKRGFH